MYSEGRKIGVWEYYNFNRELEQKYDHSKKELLYWRFYGTPDSLYYIFSGNDTITLKLDRPPLYIGGVAVMTEPILSHIKIPRFTIWLRKNHRQIIINFTVDSSGKTSNYRVSKGISRGFDRQVLKAVQNLPDDWLPAIRDGRPVTIEHCYYINYTLVRKHKDHP